MPEDYPMPPVLLIMSPQMLANYRTFGDAVSFDITYKVCNMYHESIKIGPNDIE